MKKTLILAFTILLGSVTALSANSWKNIPGFGWNLPMDMKFTANEYRNGEEVVLKNQTGIEFFYIGFNKNGFAVKGAFDVNYSGINHEMNNNPYLGLNLNLQLGVGYAPVRLEKFTLAVFGTLGYDCSIFYSESTAYSVAFQKTITSKYGEIFASCMLGGNITAVYTPASSFSLFASCSVNCVTPGVYFCSAEFSDVYANINKLYETNPTVKVIPTIGVCWKL